VDRQDNVLTVPSTALRWTPQENQVAPDVRAAQESAVEPPAERAPVRRSQRPTTREASEESSNPWREGTLWVRDGEYVRPIAVEAGLGDGSVTAVRGSDLKEGMEVVVSVAEGGSARGGSTTTGTNPFQPQFPRGGGRRGPRL
jgi:HlyD family secretion protein